ncbi:myocilin opposite strand protein [Saimiri boliviensis]|uniref:myocilin opposite strand protein n=1 Tax=Saimiri boliviensis TaxID=27679 RepID=UPI003D78A8E0
MSSANCAMLDLPGTFLTHEEYVPELVFFIHSCSDPKFLKSPECKAMAQKSPVDNTINLPYKDLTSEVTRRRVIMTTRKEIITQKSDEAKMLSHLDWEQAPPPHRTHLRVPPAPPPSPAEDATDS